MLKPSHCIVIYDMKLLYDFSLLPFFLRLLLYLGNISNLLLKISNKRQILASSYLSVLNYSPTQDLFLQTLRNWEVRGNDARKQFPTLQ